MSFFEKHRDILENQVPNNIEKYRKGTCKIRLTDKSGRPIKNQKISLHQKSHDFNYGANIFMLDEFKNEEDNQKYRKFFKEYFNTATVPFYWDGLEPEQGKPRFDKNSPKIYRRPAPDLCLEYCEENGIRPKLHCLVYDKMTPDWLPKSDEKAMEKCYEERFRQIAERYAGKMFEYEVINETLYEPGWHTQTAVSKKKDVIDWAFGLAKKYFPNETLVINEGMGFFEIANGFRHPYFMQVENALLKGVPIDKIGFQYHIFTGAYSPTEEDYENIIKRDAWRTDPTLTTRSIDVFKELGLPMEITEVTIPTFGETEQDEELQAEILKNLYSLWFSFPQIDTVVYWNTVDGYAYAKKQNDPNNSDYWDENKCRGGLFRHDLTPKKSALMLKKLFNEIWHTDIETVTDEDGYAVFSGFFGDYELCIDNKEFAFGIHKQETNEFSFEI
ncbi:MAG: endo-1,4-beta-xylanase [Clostridiales bacterium]|nr:endo-1,4-beta-xylanase [Candidatus Equinaster intestinalis]